MKVFVIYPGRFHPWHLGHKGVYDWLVSKFGGDKVFVTMTGVTDPIKSPFSFEERKKMMVVTGVPSDNIIQVTNNYNLSSISPSIPIDVEKDAVFFSISQKDMTEEPRFRSFTKKDGTPSYLQLLPTDTSKIEPAVKHGYLITVPTGKFSVLGKEMNSASELRSLYVGLDGVSKESFVRDLFGSSNSELKRVFDSKLGGLRESIEKLVRQLLREDFDQDIARLVKKRDTLDYEVERVRVKKAEAALRTHIDNMKNIESTGGDVAESKKQLSVLKKDYDASKKRLAAANTKRSAG